MKQIVITTILAFIAGLIWGINLYLFKQGEVYNIGGGRFSNCSVLEAITIIESFTGEIDYEISDKERIGDHKWYISDVSKFKSQFPNWEYRYSLTDTIEQIVKSNK